MSRQASQDATRCAKRSILIRCLVSSWVGTVWFLLSLTGCSGSAANEPTAVGLLSVPTHSSEPRAYTEFNATIAQAMAAGKTWPGDPVMVVRRFSEFGAEHQSIWIIQGTGEHPSRYEIVVIVDGLGDDSVRGERLDISLERSSDEYWRITEARVSWRCWQGRGHDYFGTKACQ